MGWKDLLVVSESTVITPWLGGRSCETLNHGRLTIEERLPDEYGWHEFLLLNNRRMKWKSVAEPQPEQFNQFTCGYLIGDRLIKDSVYVDPVPSEIFKVSEKVFLIEPGLQVFSRVKVGYFQVGSPLIYVSQEMPLGPEDEVLAKYLDKSTSVSSIAGVTPGLDATFRAMSWNRDEIERRRIENERRRREEEEKAQREERLRQLKNDASTAIGRRALATVDFAQAATFALQVGGAEYIMHRPAYNRGEMIVNFRYRRQRFECVCDSQSLRIIDAGICLVGHEWNDFDEDDEDGTGGETVRGDTFFTLESLPSVIGEAIDRGVLHVTRH